MELRSKHAMIAASLSLILFSLSSKAAISLDRTRVIFNGSSKSVSMNVSNENKHLPYLAQGWIEDAEGHKISSPLTVLPPVQRIEAGAKSQIKIQGLPAILQLPQDRESLFYFNLREIPPRSDKPNTLQIALQTRIKLFFRPQAIEATQEQMRTPWQEKITLTQEGDRYVVNNPTPYFITLVDAATSKGDKSVKGFEPLMVAPKSNAPLNVSVKVLGGSPVLTYVNDFGGRPELQFTCVSHTCTAKPVKPNS